MRILSENSSSVWMVRWGWIDLMGVLFYVGMEVFHGRIPFFDGMSNSIGAYQAYGNLFPLVAFLSGFVLLASFLVSGTLLVKQKNAGQLLAFVQFPFRMLLLMPSLFFLKYIVLGSQSSLVMFSALLLSEVLKLWSIRRNPN